jgi:hypothetical protein
MDECCNPVLLADFQQSDRDPLLFERHTGIDCAGWSRQIDFNVWYRTGERVAA